MYEVAGFVQGSVYSCSICSFCQTQQTSIASVHPIDDIYNAIYMYSGEISGYKRYLTYSRLSSGKITKHFFDIVHAELAYMGAVKLIESIPKVSTQKLRILEVGSGFGYFTAALRKLGHEVIGFDLSSIACDKASRIHGGAFISCDLDDLILNYNKYFDVVVCLEVLEHLSDPGKYITSLRSVLKNHGSLIASVPLSSLPGIWDCTEPPIHVTHFTSEGISRLAARLGASCKYVNQTNRAKHRVKPSSLPGNVMRADLVPNPRYFDNGKLMSFSDSANKLARNVLNKFILRKYNKLKVCSLGDGVHLGYVPATLCFKLDF
jgi:SAM-dependent methyltransferase